MNNAKVRFITLGCKVNQYETQGMREALEKKGVSNAEAGEGVDFVVINTCTVTGEADRENRYWIRRARREHPAAKIVVTGCAVERNQREYETLPGVDLVLRNHEKADIAARLFSGCADPEIQSAAAEPEANPKHRYTPLAISRSEGRARAFVKIQDGCNHACSFCKVVLVRGRSRSRPLQDILDEVGRLAASGYKEMVFAGIQLGAYGLDAGAGYDNAYESEALVKVLRESARIQGVERLRLSSIEPTDVRPELIRALREIPKCCPHLHIPLQSGDDETLKRMNRRYGRSFYRDLIARLRSELPDFSLTLDVMAGFPGEDETNFENTARLLEEIEPLKCHVFPYSRREGTRAAREADLPVETVRRRVRELIAAGERLGAQVRRSYEGRTMNVLVETRKNESGLLQGLTANYLKVFFQGSADWIGEIIPVEFLALQGDIFLGRAWAGSMRTPQGREEEKHGLVF